MQAAIGLTFVVLNAACWAVKVVDRAPMAWKVQEQFEVVQLSQETTQYYTQSLFRLVCLTQNTRWIADNDVAPKTPGWQRWLEVALAHKDDNQWNSIEAMRRLVVLDHTST